MTNKPTPPEPQLNGFLIILVGSVLLPFVLIGLILVVGDGWLGNEEARFYDYSVIVAVIVVFASDWIRDRPVWKRLPTWARKNGSNVLIGLGAAAYVAWFGVDPDLTGRAWWHAFWADFIQFIAVFSVFYVLWAMIGHIRTHSIARKSAD